MQLSPAQGHYVVKSRSTVERWEQRETTSYCGNGRGNCAGSGGFGRGRISDDKVCGALVVRGTAKEHLHLQIVKSDSTMVLDCDFGYRG
ncbi:MAG: hypothetical protein QOG55_2287 [Acidobacteriaceae bacterium]|nr:hypothetical protein [Acidobacteriaceae bacterium]